MSEEYLNRPLSKPGNQPASLDNDFDGAAICGVMVRADVLGKWPGDNPDLPWHANLTNYRGNLTPAQLTAAFAEAWKRWSDLIEIQPRVVQSATEALVRKAFGREDGPSGVLAWSMLADNTNRPKNQQYDMAETWLYDTTAGGIDLIRVACHEIGHVLGLGHDSGTANALMRPSYSTSIPRPTDRDVQRMVSLGYKRRTGPVPPVPVPPVPPNPTPDPAPVLGSVQVDVAAATVHVVGGWKVVKA